MRPETPKDNFFILSVIEVVLIPWTILVMIRYFNGKPSQIDTERTD